MIDAAQALEIAQKEAHARGWGGLDAERYEAKPFVHEDKPVWCVGRKRIMIGHSLWFMIDVDTGRVIEATYRGPR